MFILSDQQMQAVETAERFLSERTSTHVIRKIRDTRASRRFDADLWREMVELGLPAAAIPEEHGGIGLGFATLGRIILGAGRTLFPSPLFATSVLGASAIELAGSEEQKSLFLPLIAEGSLTLAFAHEENERHAPFAIGTRAVRTDAGYALNGLKALVVDGDTADRLVVVARTDACTDAREGLSLFLVDAGLPGIAIQPLTLVDTRSMARITFNDVAVGADAMLGDEGAAANAIEAILDRARACMAAEMLGGAIETFEQTIAYLGQREQFGVKIGSFQALKHRAAKLFTEIELAKSTTWAALDAIDTGDPELPRLSALAKARANDVLKLATNEAIQMHGGVGVTDELDLGLFLKRGRVEAQLFGSSAWLRDRYATLSGY